MAGWKDVLRFCLRWLSPGTAAPPPPPATGPGLEHTLPPNRLHHTVPRESGRMPSNVCPERHTIVAGEVRADTVSFSGKLDDGETLTGTPTLSASSPAGLTVSSPSVSTETLTVSGRCVPAGHAVTYTVSGGTGGVTYTVTVSCGTTNGQTLKARVIIPVES